MKHLKNLAVPLGAAVLFLGAAMGIYVAAWGWARFKLDFWPLDESRVGPNLCASLFLVVMVIAHNEFVVERRAEARHESHLQALRDGVKELAHPTEEAESNISEQVEEDFRKSVLDRLDENTPGGLGTIAAALKVPVKPPPPKRTIRKAKP